MTELYTPSGEIVSDFLLDELGLVECPVCHLAVPEGEAHDCPSSRLIAASPDLLAAAKEAEKAIETIWAIVKPLSMPAHIKDQIRKEIRVWSTLGLAIDKAEPGYNHEDGDA